MQRLQKLKKNCALTCMSLRYV